MNGAILTGVVLMVASTITFAARAADVDWKLYGGASVAGPSFCFYDAKTVARASSGYIRVWTKCLPQKDLDSSLDIKTDLGTKLVDHAARKLREGYVPPIVVIGKMDFQQIPEILAYEETANLSTIEPEAQFFEEMNCSERTMRRLSTSMYVNGQRHFDNKPHDWDYIPPEGNGATLLKILCSKQ